MEISTGAVNGALGMGHSVVHENLRMNGLPVTNCCAYMAIKFDNKEGLLCGVSDTRTINPDHSDFGSKVRACFERTVKYGIVPVTYGVNVCIVDGIVNIGHSLAESRPIHVQVIVVGTIKGVSAKTGLAILRDASESAIGSFMPRYNVDNGSIVPNVLYPSFA